MYFQNNADDAKPNSIKRRFATTARFTIVAAMPKGKPTDSKFNDSGLNFEAQLWAAADKMRGHMDPMFLPQI